jgi:regulatory protein
VARLSIEHDAVDDEPSARTRRRSVARRLDGKAWLRVEPEVLFELGVAEGDEIDDELRAAVEGALARARARLFVVRSLAVRMQSTAEIEKKLAARDVPPEIASEAIERAEGYGYIDDAALAGQLARGMRSRGYGRRRAEQKLRSRGLEASLAAAALAEVYDGGEDEEAAMARTALGRRAVGTDADRKRATAYLARRGFSARAAWKAVQQAAEESPPG